MLMNKTLAFLSLAQRSFMGIIECMASPTEILSPPTMYVYFLYANFALLCAAITVGVIILLRRQSTKDQMTGVAEIDYPKIASQLQREILRLQALRDRIYPEGAADAAIEEASRSSGGDQVASLASMSSDDIKALPEVQNILQSEIQALTQKHLSAMAQIEAASNTGSVSAEVDESKAIEIAQLKKELEAAKATVVAQPVVDEEAIKKLAGEVKELKDRLQEYEIFEEDLSRVKELTKENEELRSRLGVPAGSPVTASKAAPVTAAAAPAAPVEIPKPAPSEEGISMSGADIMSGNTGDAVEEYDEGAIEAAIESGSSKFSAAPEESEETSADNVTAEFEKLLSGGAPAPVNNAEVPKGFETEKVSQEPGITASKSEVVASEDDLMAEFEKLLGTVEKS